MQLAARVNRIAISPTSAVMAAAEKLKAQGVDLADFGPGEPDFPTPEHIQRAAIRALEQGERNTRRRRGSARCAKRFANGTRRNSARPTRCRNAS